jgi:ribonucleoside-diphosphate reductase beta chain
MAVAAEGVTAFAGREVRPHDPLVLYRHWKDRQWDPWEIDFSADREHWRDVASGDRRLVLWALSSPIVAKERAAASFRVLIAAHESEAERRFLGAQEADEACHVAFFGRFQGEVIAGPGAPHALAGNLARGRTRLSSGFRAIFDEALQAAHDRLAADPHDVLAKVEFVTTYHLIVQGTLSATVYNFIGRHLAERRLLPGFAEGYRRVAADERRHLAYGAWYLDRAIGRDGAIEGRIDGLLRELLPAVGRALMPADRDGIDWKALGAGSDEVREFAITVLSQQLAVLGMPLPVL